MSQKQANEPGITFLEVEAFDAIADVTRPTEMFGPWNEATPAEHQRLLLFADEASDAIREEFEVALGRASSVPSELDQVIEEMWMTGWSPARGTANVFIRDFGLAYLRAIAAERGGAIVVRSETKLDHLSVYWEEYELEYFPFHSVANRFFAREGKSLRQCLESISDVVRRTRTAG